MGFFDYEKAFSAYKNDAFMMDILSCYQDMDDYHLLRDANLTEEIAASVQIPRSAAAYRKWLDICDGGLLFSTTLLGRSDYDAELELPFSTLSEMNSEENRAGYGLPDGYFIIALLNYGAPVCLSDKDEKVYLWDPEEEIFETVWDTFADYLADEYNTAISMLEDGALNPIPLKTEGDEE